MWGYCRLRLAVGFWLLAPGWGPVPLEAQITSDSRQLPAVFQLEKDEVLFKQQVTCAPCLIDSEAPGTLLIQRKDTHPVFGYNPAPAINPTHYGVFCKIELKLERVTGIAPRFRLGSVDYVDRLEGKY